MYERYWERRNAVFKKLIDKLGILYYAVLTFAASLWFLWLGCVWEQEFLTIGVIFGIASLVMDLVFVLEWFIKNRKTKREVTLNMNKYRNHRIPVYDEDGNITGYKNL